MTLCRHGRELREIVPGGQTICEELLDAVRREYDEDSRAITDKRVGRRIKDRVGSFMKLQRLAHTGYAYVQVDRACEMLAQDGWLVRVGKDSIGIEYRRAT
jgi:hypothetical protein